MFTCIKLVIFSFFPFLFSLSLFKLTTTMNSLYKRFRKSQQPIDQDELVDYEDPETTHFNYVLEYTDKGKIKHPQFYIESTGETYYIPITMDVIRSVILKQHCNISKPNELSWFEDGLRWLSQQQYQNTNQYKYIIQDTEWDEKRQMLQYDIEDLERSCEAYFGIPLGLCQDNWAAMYLMKQASKGSILRRMKVKSSYKKFKYSVKRFFCC